MLRNVDAELKRTGQTREQLSAFLDITISTLSLKINEKSPIPVSQAMAIKKFLNTSLSLEELFASDSPDVNALEVKDVS